MAYAEDEKHRTQDEYQHILAAFILLLERWENSADSWDVIEDIITARASALITRALIGLNIDFDKALSLLRNHNSFTTDHDRQLRERVLAAVDNLIDFAAAEEYAMIQELPEQLDTESFEQYETICAKYNFTRALAENQDVVYAGAMAAWWIGISSDTMLTYMTQGDERVRPSHASLEGLTYRKSEFPSDLIPPIEYGCRCYLNEDGLTAVQGLLPEVEKREAVNPVFRESLATGGRIFSSAHPYFENTLPSRIEDIVRQIKSKFRIL